MKRRLLIILALALVTAMFAGGASRYEVVAWQENFETGATGWTHYDGAVTPGNWHVYNYGGAQADVWWQGDTALASGTNIGGYYDHQYLVLDTPARTLTADNATLNFKMAVALETPSSSTTAPEYNGWDSFNVRFSTNGGSSWSVLVPTSPTYDFSSSFPFGHPSEGFNEGVGVPAWGGSHPAWVNASFNLSAYIGQSVKIRFAFASDLAYSTIDEAGLFGVMVDDIAFGGYTNNGTDDGQMTWSSLVPLGGDLWNVATDTTAPSPTHIMKCQNAQGSINSNMLNYLVSPPITLPASGDIRVDFMLMGGFSDPNEWPEVDYWGWEITPDAGVTWYAMSNPYGTPGGSNYVYSDAPPTWSSVVESYTGVDGIISNYAGQTIQMRWYFKSDADTAEGIGIMIDDVKIFNDIFIAPPTNLAATVNGSNITLTWVAPPAGSNARDTREVTNYKVFRDGVQIDQIAGNLLTYTDMNVPAGLHSYYLIAVYGVNESLASGSATAYVLGAMDAELANDDGTAEQGFNVGPNKQMAALHEFNGPVTVKYAKVFVQTLGTVGIIFSVYDNNGVDGIPGTQLVQYQYPASSVTLGWNYVGLPAGISVPDGHFYIGIRETANSCQIGLDTSSNGSSLKYVTTAWEPVTTGEVMIRAIIEHTGVGADDPQTPVLSTKLDSNFPNPFNPETTISYSVKESTPVKLEIFNQKGQLVKSLVNEVKASGNHSVVWNGLDNNGRPTASGVYFYKMNAGKYSSTKKMIMMK